MNLSGGQKQRLFIALALINDPEVVFLDELTTGLDPQSRRAIWDLVRDIRNRGKTVFLTTHLMEEAERLCDRVAIIEHGCGFRMFSDVGMQKTVAAAVFVGISEGQLISDGIALEEGKGVSDAYVVICPRQKTWPVDIRPNHHKQVCACSGRGWN
jgi:ABC-type multidrug transport system ATPase subunit